MNVSREVDLKIKTFVELIHKWNKVINLVSANSLGDIYDRHINDSLQLVQYLNINDRIIDIGSGGGFPGVIVAICGVKNVSLVESDSRKCSFLRQVAKLASAEVKVINSRIEEMKNETCDVIIARGFSSINKIFEYTVHLNNTKYLLLKGKSVNKEIEEAQNEWLFQYKLHDSITSNDGKVVEIFNVIRK